MRRTVYFFACRGASAGQAALSTVFFIGGVIILVSILLSFFAASFIASTYGFSLSQRTLSGAISGVDDALLRLSRQKDLSGSYSFSLDGSTVTVTIASVSSVQREIVSSATIAGYRRQVRVVVGISTSSGAFSPGTWQGL